MQPGDTLLFPNTTFYLMGGIKGINLTNITIQFDGTLVFSDNIDEWPREANGKVLMQMYFEKCVNCVFTSSGRALINGKG